MNIIAFDLSLTSSGVALPKGDVLRLVPPKDPATKHMIGGPQRLHWICQRVMGHVHSSAADVVVIEGYSFQSHGAHYAAELGGVVRVALWEYRVPVAIIPPSNVKQFATGKGNAKKEAMLAAAARQLHYTGTSNDEADALWLRTMAVAHYCKLEAACTPAQRMALAKMIWPDVRLAPDLIDGKLVMDHFTQSESP